MRVPAVDRTIPAPRNGYVPLHNGDHMDAETFHALYEQTPEGFKAELIGGIVYVASPVYGFHADPHARAMTWLGLYMTRTPGVQLLDNCSMRLDEENELQPDAMLRIRSEYAGRSSLNEKGVVVGPPELLLEVAYTSRNIDLKQKMRQYEQAGVEEYVVVLAEKNEVEWFYMFNNRFRPLRATAGLLKSKVFPGLWLEPATLFSDSTDSLLDAVVEGTDSNGHSKLVAKLAARRSKDSGAP